MALSSKLEFEVKIKATADQFYQTFKNQSYQIPNMSSDKIQAIQVQKGDGKSPGSVKQWDYTLDGKEMSVKETIEAADDTKRIIKFKAMDGEILKLYKSFKATLQAIEKENGSLVKWTLEYEKRSRDTPDPIAYREFATGVTKDMDEHLAANFN